MQQEINQLQQELKSIKDGFEVKIAEVKERFFTDPRGLKVLNTKGAETIYFQIDIGMIKSHH